MRGDYSSAALAQRELERLGVFVQHRSRQLVRTVVVEEDANAS